MNKKYLMIIIFIGFFTVSCEKTKDNNKVGGNVTSTDNEEKDKNNVNTKDNNADNEALERENKIIDSAPPIVKSAREQIGKTIKYDPAYTSLAYPNGDVPIEKGVCTDVIIRALRESKNIDLQKEVHEDMKRYFSSYPKNWGAKRTDKNIDHRRVPNLRKYFERKGYSLTVTDNPENYKAGDLVTHMLKGNKPHIVVVSNRKDANGVPFVIHNIGRGTKEENKLFRFKITGHYRLQ